MITALDPSAQALQRFDAAKGKLLSTIPVHNTSATPVIDQVATTTADLVQIGGITYAIDFAAHSPKWQVATAQLPTVTSAAGNAGVPHPTCRPRWSPSPLPRASICSTARPGASRGPSR